MIGENYNYTVPCQYVPLDQYDWYLFPVYTSEQKCGYLPWNPTVYCLVAIFFGITIWASLELQLQLFSVFKRWSTLYFWSILISSWGSIFIAIGFSLRLFSHIPGANRPSYILLCFGFIMMTSGFALVLYSRLYLIANGSRILKAIFCLVIFDGVAFHTPVIVSGLISGPVGAKMYAVASHMEVSPHLPQP